jgi:hypothetical protein
VPAAQREVVHAQHDHAGGLGFRQSAEQPQQRGPADPDPKHSYRSGTGPACQRQADGLQQLVQQRASPSVSGGQPGDLRSEGARRTVVVVAEEPTYPQPEHDPLSADRGVGQAALVAAVDPGGGVSAGGAGCLARSRVSPDPHAAVDLLDVLDHNGGQVR